MQINRESFLYMDNYSLFKEAKYGLMIHFGLYSLLGGYSKNSVGPKYAEWTQCKCRISVEEMKELGKAFNPIYFDANEICEFALKCGMKYIVITTKHHEGFALFKSDCDGFNSYDFSPCHRDFISELADSCRKYGLKLGFYYSQCIDWNEKNGGGYTVDPIGCAGDSWCNNWDFPDNSSKDFNEVFYRKMLPQIKELMTNYGDVFLVWFDMPLDSTEEQSKTIYDLVKKYQPDCLVNSRLGNGMYDYVSLGDNEIPDSIPDDDSLDTQSIDQNSIKGFKKSKYGLYESACTLNRSWGYSCDDNNWKTSDDILQNRLKLEKLGINYLINIGPDWLGRIPYKSRIILEEVQKKYLEKCNSI